MANTTLGIYPVFDNKFMIGINGIDSVGTTRATPNDMREVSCLESFSVSFDNGVEEFKPLEEKGWTRRMLTGKSFSITLNGKRDVGNEGNDYLAGMVFKTGRAATTKFEWMMVDGTLVKCDCVVNVTAVGGDSTNIEALEVEFLSEGKPEIIPAETAKSTYGTNPDGSIQYPPVEA